MTGTHRPLTVVYLGHTSALSGAEIGLARLLEASPDIRAHVILAEDGPLVDRLRAGGVEVEVLALAERVRSVRRKDVASGSTVLRTAGAVGAYSVRLARRISVFAPDLVHANSLKSGIYGAAAARIARLPFVWGLHDRVAADYLPTAAVRPLRLLVKTVPDGLVVPSQATLALMSSVAASEGQ